MAKVLDPEGLDPRPVPATASEPDVAAAQAARSSRVQPAELSDIEVRAAVTGLKLGATLVRWIPWPMCPEEQWVPIRSLSMPELDQAYLFAIGKCKELDRQDDEHLFTRWQQYALLSFAIRKGVALQKGVLADGTIDLQIVHAETNFDLPMFDTPNDVRVAMRDKAMLDELLKQYWLHCEVAVPLSTARKLAQAEKYEALLKQLKKKHGAIDLGVFSQVDLVQFMLFLVSALPDAHGDGTPA